MKICQRHRGLCIDTIDDFGLYQLREHCDPLDVLQGRICVYALHLGGPYLLQKNPDAKDGHYCPMCEMEEHLNGYSADSNVAEFASDMAKWARDNRWIAQLN